MAPPREALAEVDGLEAAALELPEADALADGELDAGADDATVGGDDTADAITEAADGADAVPPTLAHDESNTVAAAIEMSGIVSPRPRTERRRMASEVRRVIGRPCDMSPFCQPR